MKAKANNMLPIKYRVWDKDRKKMNYPGWELEDKNRANDLDLDEMTTHEKAGYYLLNQDGVVFCNDGVTLDDWHESYIVMLCSPFKDKHGKDIYAEDVVELVNMDNEKVLAVCRYGVARRKMDGGDEVDIPGFHFELEDGRKTFPIVNNYAGKHDLELFEIIGHTFK